MFTTSSLLGVTRAAPSCPFRCLTRLARLLACVATAAWLGACSTAHYFVNRPLDAYKRDAGYSMRNLESHGNTDSLLVVVSISGGGYRAAALGYAVLDALRETQIEWGGRSTSLLDEVDFLTGVSGGALITAYYVAFREETFSRFERDVLGFDLQGHLLSRSLSPRGLWRQTSRRFGRGDILAEVLDEHIFKGVRYADIARRRPMAIILATDMEYGGRFEFSQDQFDHLCTDLDTFPLSRAVAASMAVPLLLSPVTVWNHASECAVTLGRPLLVKSQASRSRYVHLLDGALADNTGVQTPLEVIAVRGGIINSARAAGLAGIRKRVFIIVNAQVSPLLDEDAKPDTPSLRRQLRALGVPIARYSAASIDLLKREVLRWQAELAAATDAQLGGTISRDADFFVVEVSLTAPPADVDVGALSQVPTTLRISESDSRALQAYARTALRQNAEWQRLMGQLQPATTQGPVPISPRAR